MRFGKALAAALLAAGLAAQARAEVTVFAAASLSGALDEVAAAWEAAGGESIVAVYAGTSQLARHIEAGAPADVFVSASVDWMDHVEAAGLIDPESRVDLLANRLALVASGPKSAAEAAGAPAEIGPGFDLPARLGDGRLAVALTDSVPAGLYARAALTSLGLWEGVKDRLAEADDVRAALAFVARGEAPFGIVYTTDAAAEPRVSVVGLFPETSHPPIVYPAAAVAGGDAEAARAFLDHLRSEDAAAIFRRRGFSPL